MRLLPLACSLLLAVSSLGPTAPAPASATPFSQCDQPNVVAVDTFSVPAGTTRVFDAPTAIKARNVNVAGALLTRDGAGDDAPALCIEAEKVVVAALGVICTGSGDDGAGVLGTYSAQGEDGTEGGDLSIILKDNPTTLTGPSLDLLGLICSGDGGDGGPGVLEPCLPASLGTTDSAIPTCENHPCDGCGEPCAEGMKDCLPPVEPCKEKCVPDLCKVPHVRRAFGGDAGDAGLLSLYGPATSLALAPASLKAGRGGDGGDAYTFGGLRGSNEAYGGAAGDSRVLINGAPGSALLGFVGASVGGNGGDALAAVAPECGGNDPCKDAIWENRTYCVVRDVLEKACPKPTPEGPSICENPNHVFEEYAGKPLYGYNGASDTDAPTGPDPADPGYDGADSSAGAAWQTDCGVEVTPTPPFGGAGCGASASCSGGRAAAPGFYGEPGYSAASAHANATAGGYGALKGGEGGAATATGATGGTGGTGGKGGRGDVGCLQSRNGGPGGKGGRGGPGGSATAIAGAGGMSDVQGGKGGDAQANPGAGGAGGVGGSGGDPHPACNAYTGECLPEWQYGDYTSWGGYWGCGGGGGAAGGYTPIPGAGGQKQNPAGQDGPKGAVLPPAATPAAYGATGKAGAQYLAEPSCPV